MDSLLVAIRSALKGWQTGIWTAMPAILQKYDATKLTCQAQPAIQAQVRSSSGSISNQTLPLLVDCPVVFPGGGGYVLTFPLAANDEGLIIIASRCIDAWWQNGGIQPQAELRMHDLSDGFFLPGVFSVPRVPSNIATDRVQLRSNDGSCSISLESGHVCEIIAPGGIKMTGPVSITGDVTATGLIEAGHGTVDSVKLQTHKHGTGTAAAGTVVPTPGT